MADGLSELLSRFLLKYPQINIVQHATNRFVDLVDEGFDVGLRGHSGALADSSLVQRVLAKTPWHLFAGPTFCAKAGTPRDPSDLRPLAALMVGARSGDAAWKLRHRDGDETIVPVIPRLRSDDIATLKAAAVANLGIAALPWYVARREVAQGSLIRVLPDWIAGDNQVTLLTLPSVRAFIDFLVAEFPAVIADPV